MRFSFRLIAVAVSLVIMGSDPAWAQAPASPGATAAPPTGVLEKLTKADVEAMIQKMDAAIKAKDVATIEAMLAPDVTAVVQNMPTASGPQKVEMNRDTYVQSLKESFAVCQDYSHTRKDVVIEIQDGGKKAQITATVSESYTAQGYSLQSVTKESSIIELREGRLLVVTTSADIVEMKKK